MPVVLSMDEELVSIVEYFRTINISIKCDFLLAVKKFYTETKGAPKLISLKDFVFYQWLHNDINHTLVHKSSPLKYPKDGNLLINQVFQINYAERIDVPMYSVYTELSETKGDLAWYNNQDDDNEDFYSSLDFTSNNLEKNRVLLMELSDGSSVLKAIEKQPIVGLKTIVTPGIKIAIHGRVFISNGVLYIDNTLATVLGGDVEELYKKNNMKSVIERKLRIPESYKKKIKQIQDSKRKRTTLPEPPEASKEFMKRWLNKSKISTSDFSDGSKSLLDRSRCSNNDLNSTSSTNDEMIDTKVSYGSNIIKRNDVTDSSTKTKKKFDHLFRPISNKFKTSKDSTVGICHNKSQNLQKITGYCTPMKHKYGLFSQKKEKVETPMSSNNLASISSNNHVDFSSSSSGMFNNDNDRKLSTPHTPNKRHLTLYDKENFISDKTPVSKNEIKPKYGLSLRKQSEENILNNRTFRNLEMSTLKSKEFSLINELRPKICYDIKQPLASNKLSNSYVMPRVSYDNQSSKVPSITPSSGNLNKTSSKNERNTLANVQQFSYSQFNKGQGICAGFREDQFPNVINFNAKDDNVKSNISNKRRSLDSSASNISSNYRSRYSHLESDRNLQSITPDSYYKLSDNYKTKGSSHSDIDMINILNRSSDFDKGSFSTSYDKSEISLTQTSLLKKRDEHFNTSNNSDVFVIPPSKLSKLDNSYQKQSQLSTCDFNTIGDSKKKMDMSFGVEILDIKGKVVKITKYLTIKNNQWTMEVEIKDGNEESLICPIHDKYISRFLGVSASENSDKCDQNEVEKRKHFFYKQLSKKNDLIFSIEMFPTQSIEPVIKDIKTVQEAEVKASQYYA